MTKLGLDPSRTPENTGDLARYRNKDETLRDFYRNVGCRRPIRASGDQGGEIAHRRIWLTRKHMTVEERNRGDPKGVESKLQGLISSSPELQRQMPVYPIYGLVL